MPSSQRRAFLGTLGTATAALVAGCSGDAADGSTTTTSGRTTDGTETSTTAETTTGTTTQSGGPSLGDGPGRLPAEAWPLPNRGPANGGYLPDGVAFEDAPSVDWRVEPTPPPDLADGPFDPTFGKPVLADGRLYAVVRLEFGPEHPMPDRHPLRAYDPGDGSRLWEYAITDGSGDGTPVPTYPAFGADAVLVGAGDSLHAVDPADGTAGWTRTFPGSGLRSPAGRGTAYPARERTYLPLADRENALLALDGGETAWTTAFEGGLVYALARGERHLYAGVGRTVSALDPGTGDVAWRQTVPDAESGVAVTRLVAATGGVFARQARGDVYAITDAGGQVWHAGGRSQALATDGSSLYVAMANGTLRALDPATGEARWEHRFDGAGLGFSGPPVVADEVLYAAVDGGPLAAFRPGDGTVLWTKGVALDALLLGPDALYGVDDGALVALR